MTYTLAERLILANQFEILAKLYPQHVKMYERMGRVIEGGFEGEYGSLTAHIVQGENIMTPLECDEVVDILNMFIALKESYDALGQKTHVDKDAVEFIGFDASTMPEGKYFRYAIFLIRRDQSFSSLDRTDLNSHAPVLARYRKMLDIWKSLGQENRLSIDKISKIISI